MLIIKVSKENSYDHPRPMKPGVQLIRIGQRRFIFVLASLGTTAKLTRPAATQKTAARRLYERWPSLYFDWHYGAQRRPRVKYADIPLVTTGPWPKR